MKQHRCSGSVLAKRPLWLIIGPLISHVASFFGEVWQNPASTHSTLDENLRFNLRLKFRIIGAEL